MNTVTRTEDVKGDEVKALKKEYFKQIEAHTPKDIKENPIFDLKDPKAQKITLTKELVEKWQLREWFAMYKKEAMVSTAGIRGAQNVLYPWDTRYPLNQVGVALATIGKAMVLKEDIKDRDIHKICSGEVRYNTDEYIEIISRIQAAQGIVTHTPKDKEKTSIWMTSFLIFMLDYDGGEYVTSSHAMSSKIATKDLDDQGSQFIPEMSMRFVEKIKEILDTAEKEGFDIKLAEKDSPLIRHDFTGIDLYYDYLKKGIATDTSIELIKTQIKHGINIMYECVGGCMFTIMDKLFKKLEIEEAFSWNNTNHDPFFHGMGKTMYNPIAKKEGFFDWGCDTTLRQVITSIGYDKLLKSKGIGYMVIMVDPDGDRIVLGQVESAKNKEKLDDIGVLHFDIDDDKIFAFYMPNQSFFLTMNYYAQQLKAAGLWDDHPRFIITTTPSAATWVEWAEKCGVKAINVPVGFKEIATIMKKVEKQIKDSPDKDVILHDIFGTEHNLGTEPRLLFAGEESGGMITGPEELIKSKKGRVAIAMREKSAAEASVICTAMIAQLYKDKKLLSDYLEEIFAQYNIRWKYDVRIDRKLYNESNPDPESLKKEKAEGEIIRDKVDDFYLAIALSVRDGKITVDAAKEILTEAIGLDFSKLENIFFVGDGTYLKFSDKYVEVRKSGTDANIKSYAAGVDKKECIRYAEKIAYYDGEITPKYKELIPKDIKDNCQDIAMRLLREFQKKI